jgi:hypothetical protein
LQGNRDPLARVLHGSLSEHRPSMHRAFHSHCMI